MNKYQRIKSSISGEIPNQTTTASIPPGQFKLAQQPADASNGNYNSSVNIWLNDLATNSNTDKSSSNYLLNKLTAHNSITNSNPIINTNSNNNNSGSDSLIINFNSTKSSDLAGRGEEHENLEISKKQKNSAHHSNFNLNTNKMYKFKQNNKSSSTSSTSSSSSTRSSSSSSRASSSTHHSLKRMNKNKIKTKVPRSENLINFEDGGSKYVINTATATAMTESPILTGDLDEYDYDQSQF